MKLDVFKNAVSLPGIARHIIFSYARKNNAQFSLIDKKNADLYTTYQNNMVGGPSSLFQRRAEKGKTFIRGGKNSTSK